MSARTMISFVVGANRFNYRVAGIALRQGHVLVCVEGDDDYAMLPGGRVEMGEPSHVALAREIVEELQSPAEIVRLVFTAENFFDHLGKHVHELAAYYLIELPAEFPFRSGGICFETKAEGEHLKFEWVPIEGPALVVRNLTPRWIVDRLSDLPTTTEHLVMRETP